MLKKTITNNKHTSNGLHTTENYGFEPPRIGPLLKQKAETLKLKPKHVAPLVDRETESIYRIYKRKYLTMPEMKTWSEALRENLLPLYHPNIKPLPTAEEALRKELEEVKKERDELRNDLVIEKNHGLKLEGKIEVLEEQAAEFWRKRG